MILFKEILRKYNKAFINYCVNKVYARDRGIVWRSRNSERSASESSYVFRLLILAAERRSIWDGVPRSLSWTGKGSFKFCWVSFQNQVNQKYNLSTQMYSFDSFSRVQQVFLAYFSVDTVEGLKNHHKQFSVLDQCFSCCPSATLCPYMRFLIGCLQSYWS